MIFGQNGFNFFNAIPSFSAAPCRPLRLAAPSCRPAFCRPASLPLCRPAASSCRPVLPLCPAALPPRPTRPGSGRIRPMAHAISSFFPRSGENPPAVKLRFLHDLTRAATKNDPVEGRFHRVASPFSRRYRRIRRPAPPRARSSTGPATGTQLYPQPLGPFALMGRMLWAMRGGRSRAGLIA